MLPEMLKLEGREGVQKVHTDMCQFGMHSRIGGVGTDLGLVLKPTGFLTNCKHIARELSRRCPRDHVHVPLVGGRAADAAIYPVGLCRAICQGLASQIEEDGGRRIDSPWLDTNGLKSLRHLCQEATTPELNSLFERPLNSKLSPEEDARREELNILMELRSLLSDGIVDSKRLQDPTLLTGLPRSEEVTHGTVVDLQSIQMEVEGEQNIPTGRFRRKRLNPTTRPSGQWPDHWIDSVHEADGHYMNDCAGLRGGETMLNNAMSSLYAEAGVEYAVDNVSGALLDPKLVHAGRATEMKFFQRHESLRQGAQIRPGQNRWENNRDEMDC